jgi:hypothetical protein
MKTLLALIFSFLGLISPVYAACVSFTPVTINFEYSDPKFNVAQILLQSNPTLIVDGTEITLRSIEDAESSSHNLNYCVRSEALDGSDVSFELGGKIYPNLQLLDGDHGPKIAIFEADDPALGFVTDMQVAYRGRISRVGISFNVHNTQRLGFSTGPTITTRWTTNSACGAPQPVERQFTIGIYQGRFDLTETVNGVERARALLPASAGATLTGDYCSEEGVTLVIKSAPLEFDPESNSQRVLIDIELTEGARELLEAEGLTLSDWAIEFDPDASLAKPEYLSLFPCAAEYSLVANSRPARIYFNGKSDQISDFAVRNAEYLTQVRLPIIAEFSQELLGTSPEVEVTYENNTQCFDGPHIQDGRINLPPLFLELLMLKAEDTEIAEQLVGSFAIINPFSLSDEEDVVEDQITCAYALLNMNHRQYTFSPADVCGLAFNDFYEIWRGLRTSSEKMADVAVVYRDALEFALAHEYGHFALGHLDRELTKEDEIEADLFAYRYLANEYGEAYAFAMMKMFFATYANLLDLPETARAEFAAAQNAAFMPSSTETDRYLTSECRSFETLEAAGVEDAILAEIDTGIDALFQGMGSEVFDQLSSKTGIAPLGLLARCN